MKNRLLTILIATLPLLSACYESGAPAYGGPWFVWFDTGASSTTSVNELGELVGSYLVHYSGPTAESKFNVGFSVTAGDGLKEGVDYEFVSPAVSAGKGSLTFLPGVFTSTVNIRWLSNEIDASKDCSLKLTLEDSTMEGLVMGYPGPDGRSASITIKKYKN